MKQRGGWRKRIRIAVAMFVMCLLVFVVEILLAIPGPDDHFHNPARQPMRFAGPGKPWVYVVLGDSTAAGRGGNYATGIAMQTARHLARSRSLILVNLAVSGAKVRDVQQNQLPTALRLRPDLVLLAIGANDATHFTPSGRFDADLSRIVASLAAARPGVRIVLTGSPALGTARRFAQPLRWLAGQEADRINRGVDTVIQSAVRRHEPVVLDPIARETGPFFQNNPGLFAPDRFHPNDRGYAVWLPVLNAAFDKALQK